MKIPLGERESVQLEFKGAESMTHPESIIRAVVAMLNTEGGAVWVGLGEEGGAARSVQPLSDPEKARIKLRDLLVELVEPTPVGVAEPLVVGDLVVVRVKQGRDRPYALRSGSRREYLGRFEDRTRALSYEELKEAFAEGQARPLQDLTSARRRVGALRRLNPEGLVLIAVPLPELPIPTNEASTRMAVEAIVRDHQATGSRRMGWTFHTERPEVKFERRDLVASAGLGDQVRVTARGDMVFSTVPNRLRWAGSRGPDPQRDVHPIVLVELVTSAMRILSRLVEQELHERPPRQWVLHLSLLGMEGWSLAGGSPSRWSVQTQVGKFEEGEVSSPDLLIGAEELMRTPDRVALTLLKQLYADFGLTTDQLPPEFDQEQGVLRLND